MRQGTCTENNAQQKIISLRQSRGAMPHISQSGLCLSSATTERPDHHWLIMAHFWDLRADDVDRRWGFKIIVIGYFGHPMSSLTDRVRGSGRMPPA
jgi:hypothetical protein